MMVALVRHLCNYRRMSDGPNLIPTVEVCSRLGVDKSTVSRWVASGRIKPALASRNGNWFDPAEVDRIQAEIEAAAS